MTGMIIWFRGQHRHFKECRKVKWPQLVFNWHLTDRLGEPLKDSPQTLFLTPYFCCKGLQTVYIKSRNRQRSWPNPWPHLSHLPNILLSTAHTQIYTHEHRFNVPIKSIKQRSHNTAKNFLTKHKREMSSVLYGPASDWSFTLVHNIVWWRLWFLFKVTFSLRSWFALKASQVPGGFMTSLPLCRKSLPFG